MHTQGSVGIGINVGRGPARIRRAVVLVPGDGVVVFRGRDNVEIAIAVEVTDIDRLGSGGSRGDIGRRPAGVTGPVVLVPGNGVVK